MRRILWNSAVFLAICGLIASIAVACSSPGSGNEGEPDPTATTSETDPASPTHTDNPTDSPTDAPSSTAPPVTSPDEPSTPDQPDTPEATDPSTPDQPEQGTAVPSDPPETPHNPGPPTVPPPTSWSPDVDPTVVYSTPEIPDPTPTQNSNPQPAEGILPNYRVVSFYGHPNSDQMGILGEYATKEDALAALQQVAAEYAAADPSLPVLPAFELIATVAQPHPGDDGNYLAETGAHIIQEFVDFTAANNMLLILDLQIGHDTIPNQIHSMREFLKYPHVHVALDPEFSTAANPGVPRDRAPGEFIGEVNGHDVNLAIQMLSDFVAEHGLPRKMLIVHQFEDEMIYNKYVITPQPGVDFVLDMDGFGAPENKIGGYMHYVAEELIQYGGIKLFYQQDAPLLSPADVVALNPSPLVVIYQ